MIRDIDGRCTYCNSQKLELHSVECQVFHLLDGHPEAHADMWSAWMATIVAANEFIRLNNAQSMGQREYEIMVAVIDKLIEEDPHSEPLFDRSTL